MPLGEFELIARFFGGLDRGDGIMLGLGDDAALVEPGLAVCIDTLVAGVHFPLDATPESVGHKALAVNLSDLAAMGAEPAWALLALTLPEANPEWLEAFARGFRALAESSGTALIGGDTTRGSLTVSVQVAGRVPPDRALRRSGAQPGDGIYVSGSLGDAAGGLALWRNGVREGELIERLSRPSPRVALGRGLCGLASAAIDISDGLLSDLGHVLAASGVGAAIAVDALPLSPTLTQRFPEAHAQQWALSGGDDYELCFTVPSACEGRISELAERLRLPLTRIGEITNGSGIRLSLHDEPYRYDRRGYDHFAEGEDEV